jgi:hypothetical protein
MAHAKLDDLKDISTLLREIRGMDAVKEKSPGCFYLKGKGVLHFHVQQGRRFAHVFNGTEWEEVDLPDKPSVVQQRAYLKKIKGLLPISREVRK